MAPIRQQHPHLSAKWNVILFTLMLIVTILLSFYFLKFNLVLPTVLISLNNHTIVQKKTPECIVHVQNSGGRFGNRMFIVASAYGLARLHSCHLYIASEIIDELRSVFVLDLSPLLISSSTFKLISNDSSKPMTRMSKVVICDYLTELTRPNAIPPGSIFEVKGYWQSYLHFARYGDELRHRIFIASQPTLEKVSRYFPEPYQRKPDVKPQLSFGDHHQSFKKQLAQSNLTTWIGIHVRRRDFVPQKFSSSDAYFFAAIQYYTVRYPNAYFIVASDDKPYCGNLFRNRSNIFLTPLSFSLSDDLIILSLCQHSIITGGTFGWWAGYLADGLVIHDTPYPSGCQRREYYYPPWFLIDGKVRAQKNTDYVLK